MKKKRSFHLGVEQIEDRLTPSVTPAQVYDAAVQVHIDTQILHFVTNQQLVGNPILQPYVDKFLTYVNQTDSADIKIIDEFVNDIMNQDAGNPLIADSMAPSMVGYSTLVFEAEVDMVYAKNFAKVLNFPLSPPAAPTSPPAAFGAPGSSTSPPPVTAQTADLAVTNTDANATYTPGGNVTYTVIANNQGPASVSGATFTDTLDANLSNVSWTAVYSSGASGPASGTGNINTTLNLGNGTDAIFSISGTVSANATGNLTSTATITAPAGTTDPNASNNTATDVDVNVSTNADLQVTVTDSNATYTAGGNITYSIVATNNGPSNVIGATVADNFDGNLTNVTWTAVYNGSGSGPANGTGNISALINLASGANATFTITGNILANTTGNLVDTATITPPASNTDGNATNNTSTDTDLPVGTLDLTSTAGMTNVLPSTATGFTTLSGGVMIKDDIVGNGTPITSTSTATIYYIGWLNANGTVFDHQTTSGSPIQFGLGNTIPGFQEGLAGMEPGGIRDIFIPSSLAYGANGTTGIPPNSDLVFEVKLISSP